MQSTDSTLFDMETPLLGRRQFGLARSYGTSATLHCINRAIAGPIMSGQGGSRCCPLLGIVPAVRQTSARGSSRTESVLAPRACGLDHRRRTWPRVYGPVAVHRADRQRRRRVMARTPSPPAAPPATHHGVEAPATRPQTFTKRSACCAISLVVHRNSSARDSEGVNRVLVTLGRRAALAGRRGRCDEGARRGHDPTPHSRLPRCPASGRYAPETVACQKAM